MTELPGLEHDPVEWAALKERHAAQEKALAKFLRLMSGIARDFGKLHGDVVTLHRGVRELGRQQRAFGEPGRSWPRGGHPVASR